MTEEQLKNECYERWKDLTLSNNFIFQKFMSNPENCKKVLSEILGKEVINVEYPIYEKVIDIREDSKSIRLDVYVKGDDAIYNVEMQCAENAPIPKRSRYYQDMIDLDILEKGNSYSILGRSFVIFICTFDYYKRGRYKYTFSTKCEEEEDLYFGDEITKIIINTRGSIGEISQDFEDFIHAVNGEYQNSGYSNIIRSEVEKIKDNKKWRREYMTLTLRERVMQMEYMNRGIEQGRQQGIEQGRQQAIEEAIKNMLKELPAEKIVAMGYEKELVEKIAGE